MGTDPQEQPAALQARPTRHITCLNGEWEFKCDAVSDWTTIQVPGCYCDERAGKWAKEYWDAHGYPCEWTGKGATYRRTVTLTAEQLARSLVFRCEGCYHVYRVLLNGMEVGATRDGHTPLECRLNQAAQEGENHLDVVIDADPGPLPGGESTGSRGIWQDVFLVSHDPLHIEGTPRVYTLYFRPVNDGMLAIDGTEVLGFRYAGGTPMPRWARVPMKAGAHPVLIHATDGLHELEWEGPGIERRKLTPDEYGH